MPRVSSRVFAGTRHLLPGQVHFPTLIGFASFFDLTMAPFFFVEKYQKKQSQSIDQFSESTVQ